MSFSISCLPMLLWGGEQKGRSPDVSSRLFEGGTEVFTTIWQAVTVTLPWLTVSYTVFLCVCIEGWNAETLNPKCTCFFFFFFLTLLKCRSQTHAGFCCFGCSSSILNISDQSLTSSSSFQIQNCLFFSSTKFLTVSLHMKQLNEECHPQKAPSIGSSQF